MAVASLSESCTVTKPTPYSNSTHFSDHFTYHITFPFVITWQSGSCQAHQTATTLLHTWPGAHSHDCQPHHMTVSLTPYVPFTLLATHSYLPHYYSALPLTFTLTPRHTLIFSLVSHLHLLPLSQYYDSLPYQSFPLHDLLPYQPLFATILITFDTLFKPLYLNYTYYLYYSSVWLVSYLYYYIYCAVKIPDPHFVLAPWILCAT